MVKEETFKGIYAQYFPKGAETTQYAHYVFNSFDHDNTGAITFTDFVIGLSVLARGSLQEKLRWAFSLYDINGDGYITKDELSKIVQSIYELMGKAVEPMIEDHTTRDHVDRVFQKLDLNKDGVVTIEEFLDSCQRDENITRNMQVFNTIFKNHWDQNAFAFPSLRVFLVSVLFACSPTLVAEKILSLYLREDSPCLEAAHSFVGNRLSADSSPHALFTSDPGQVTQVPRRDVEQRLCLNV
ncbi:kv channel-interacting protein 4 [Nephila pilipes]|uniref:Kv channel-interacting protein 4 n=1 Tax=Nephila pilipes TaxID=299642 RepID=A0A8X6R325_NEPPI|nr:kv channel-interacting protein 4 [Nephila pilipes]